MSDKLESFFRLNPGDSVKLKRYDPDDTSKYSGKKKAALAEISELKKKISRLQELLYAEKKHAFLIVLQGMDAAGKDSTIRLVFDGVDPQGVRVVSFGKPTPLEQSHDFLWRIHKEVPAKGEIVIFNRSHYESVLVERVHDLVPKREENRRYEEIVEFEKMLVSEGTVILKFFLHIKKKEQKKRLEERLEDNTKEWKLSENDLAERDYWDEYIKAYERALEKTSTKIAPWYIVPSDHKWFRDLIVARTIVKTLEELNLKYPTLPKKKKDSIEIT
jgi:PPK2 family polyphosphate:nucleotide phosphotransferase